MLYVDHGIPREAAAIDEKGRKTRSMKLEYKDMPTPLRRLFRVLHEVQKLIAHYHDAKNAR